MIRGTVAALSDRLDAADPGAVRRYHAARAALAALTAWLALHLVFLEIIHRPMPAAGLFAVVVCFVNALIIADPRRAERQRTLALSFAATALGLIIASLLHGTGWPALAALLVLIFASYAVRPRGPRAGELVLVLTMSLYFAEGSGVTWSGLPWFLLAAATGVASFWLWQFVLLPYDPRRSLRSSIRSLYRATADAVAAVVVALESAPTPADALTMREGPAATSQTSEAQPPGHRRQPSPACSAPGAGAQAQVARLQVALYNTEQGLALMVEGAAQRSDLSQVPAKIRAPLLRGLRSLGEALAGGGIASMQALAAESAGLRAEVRAYARTALGREARDPHAPLAPWVATALRLVGGSTQLAQSAGQVRDIEAQREDGAEPTQPQPDDAPTRKTAASPPSRRLFGGVLAHPATVLGIQAVLATGSAMLVAWLLNMDHSNWVFWTAFVVIAGSTGESLRKMMLRVVGTVTGATVGVALAVLTPDNTPFIVGVGVVCIFLTIYSWPLSYPRMVFWLNIGFVVAYTSLGAHALDLLLARPLTTLVGGLVAALVVVFVFPIRTGDRFRLAAAHFLGAVDGYVSAFVEAAGNSRPAQPLDTAFAGVAATYAQVEQTLPGVVFENNPLQQAQSPLNHQATRVAALEAEVERLARTALEDAGSADDPAAAERMRTQQALIHRDIQAILPLLKGDKDSAPQARPSAAEISAGELLTSREAALIRIYRIVNQLAKELGAPG